MSPAGDDATDRPVPGGNPDGRAARSTEGRSRRTVDASTRRTADGSTRRAADGSTRRAADGSTRRAADGSTRRRFLQVGAVGAAVSLGGCLGGVRKRLAGGSTAAGSGRDVIRLDSLDVAGSPGTTVPLRAPDRLSLVDFFATWCGPCRPQMGTLRQVREEFAGDRLHMVSVTTESDGSAVRQFWKQYDGAWPVVLNPESTAVRKYSVKGIPTLVLAAPDGTIHWRHRGLAGFETLETEIRNALES